jgi:hypothetical protein
LGLEAKDGIQVTPRKAIAMTTYRIQELELGFRMEQPRRRSGGTFVLLADHRKTRDCNVPKRAKAKTPVGLVKTKGRNTSCTLQESHRL